ncbi:MASE1 domain-containing protein [Aurantiacibacter sp. MUD11]|uniref:MASE1 domain-containing protein n=1 Tax=Aurantiacibacter sp. MUD11 TaxID=3003265 RepID=UPI0022AB13D6|nr:MASE1 domain-containing protein [Aurantiacibacter sp. MUD11]WAT17891.1 MASE1 domain-containing protein [Aurantiacibacter sp. MUD11]
MRIWRHLREPVAAGLLWGALASLCLLVRDVWGGQLLLWAPSGVAVAAFHATRRSRWALLTVVLLPMQAATVWLWGTPLPQAFIYSTASLVQTVVAASLGIAALGGRREVPRRFRQVAGLFGAALIGCLVGALIAIPFRAEQTLAEFAWWFLANVLAILTLTPVLLLARQMLGIGARVQNAMMDRSILLTLLGCAGLAVVALQVSEVALMPLLVAAMVFATVRYGQTASALTILTYVLVATVLSIFAGSPMPFLDMPAGQATLVLQSWMLTMRCRSPPCCSSARNCNCN